MPECSICSVKFNYNKNLYHHMRNKHKINPQVPGKIICPFECAEKFRIYADLRHHLASFHKLVLESEVLEFPNFENFEIRKKRHEGTTGYRYICRNSEKALRKKGDLRSFFICHRSGFNKSVSTGQRKSSKFRSCKIGKTCPSLMEVSKSLTDGRVKVVFYKTHIGHGVSVLDSPLRKIRISKKSEMIDFNVCAVIPAAGIGERMGLDMPKQYFPIHQKPLICYTVEAFLKMPFIKKVVVVASPESLDLMLETLRQTCALEGDKLMATEGFGSRHHSIKSGITALQTYCELESDVVIIHDGVRPFVSIDTACDIVKAAKQYGAAGVVCPLVSTVISVNTEGFLEESLDRSKFRASEMPQAFKYEVICKAYEKCSEHDLEHGTECLQLVYKYAGVRAKLLPGNSHLWKVTHRKDLHACAAAVKENQSVAIVNHKCAVDLLPSLKVTFFKTFENVHVVDEFTRNLLNKHPNVVIMSDEANPYNILEYLSILTNEEKLTQLSTMVYILHDFDQTINLLVFQRQAKANAQKLRAFNVLVYFVVLDENECRDNFEEVAELAKSLLFDSNPNISGSVFLT